MKFTKNNYLNRFTSCNFAIEMLNTKILKAPRPNSWPDKNDVMPLELFMTAKNATDLFALCFTDEAETVYHWYILNDFNNTCCIEFDKKKIVEILDNNGFVSKKVSYKKFKKSKDGSVNKSIIDPALTVNEIPFLKRFPYRNEKEFRSIWTGEDSSQLKDIPITLDCIRKITVPTDKWRNDFINIRDCIGAKFDINKSSIEYSKEWINKMDKIIKK